MSVRDIFDTAADAVNRALGDVVVWKPGTPDETELKAVFGYGFDRVSSGRIRVSSRQPELRVRMDDLPADPAVGDALQLPGRSLTFSVVNYQADVESVTWHLVLKET